MFFLKEVWFLLLFLVGYSTGDDSELNLNVIGFTSTPAVKGYKIDETVIQGFSSDNSSKITLSINRLANREEFSGEQLCNSSDNIVNSGVHQYVDCSCRGPKSCTAEISCEPAGDCSVDARVGVFTAYAEKGSRNGTATIIVHDYRTDVKPIVRAKTVSAGDSNVTLGVREGSNRNLRWKKDAVLNTTRNDMTEILFDTISLADAGIYECYDEENSEEHHAFMQLIVRECPHNKWFPPNCNMSCEVCYNGGVCDTYIGNCICPSGFKGTNCTIPTGNIFGSDEECFTDNNNNGNGNNNNNNGCKGKLVCPPMPQGCACHAGWEGIDCKTECENGKYGADCLQDCHCDFDNCDTSRGCEENATCHSGYKSPRCLVSSEESSDRTTSMKTPYATNSNGPSSDRTTSMETTHATSTIGPTSDRTTSLETTYATNTNGPTRDRTTSMETTHATNSHGPSSDRTTSMETSHGNVYW
ncbi:tyrosine-protein kinase receptor Tie-1-like [Anneissia japonica]|uniref:tyrosine-protein kinase receptor Tie-1-like n=1 Tax=Anneissia japonica TaxID=1529436 RepID=UPI0014255057|nr:tyrosine-protein kinase receptor Tie-1-like [Anneissia japonica]XP_033123072.1 tyrosine-protein kinase receptor Tie-1-like [Anneissia japonica]